MSIQQNMASDIYRMADSVHRSRDIAAFQQSLAQSIKSGAVESYVGIPVLQSLTQKLKLAQQKEAMAMAAPQGQQQQGVPIAAQVMQDAGQTDEDEQRYAGIDELRTNLPTAEDDNNDEYANGGIIAFADEGQVRDSNSDPLVERLREDDPKAFERSSPLGRWWEKNVTPRWNDAVGNAKTLQQWETNDPTRPGFDEDTINAGPLGVFVNQTDAEREAAKRRQYPALGVDASGNFKQAPRDGRISAAEAAQAEMLKAEAASPGVAGLPAAQNVKIEPDRQGAGGAGAGGERLTPKVGLENAPSTLAKAEAAVGKSPAAAQAVSMLDEFIADLKKSGQNVSRDKKEAFYMALIKGGLAAAGGTSPNALANISAGMVPAIEGYGKAIEGIRKDERARLEKLVAAGVSKEKIGLEAKKLGITEKHYDDWYKVETAKMGIMAGSREDMKRLSVAQGLFKNLTGKMIMPTDAELDTAWEQAQRMAGKSGASPKITDVVANYFPGNAPDKRYVPK